MLLDLAALEDPELGDLDWTRDAPLRTLARTNDDAYGYEAGTFARAIGATPPDTYRMYEARAEGVAASVLGTLDHEEDCAVLWVATSPAAQGRGLATRLLHLALAEARERGCATATLQATEAGAHLYRRLGFRELGALHMWERRR
jgi:ribosomal protein S18 acetylase RimI-like enzyme